MATMLAEAVKFKALIQQLERNEFTRLMGKIYDAHQSDLIGTALFKHLTQNNNDENMHDLRHINSAISTIIKSRKSKPKKHAISNAKLDKFPLPIIGCVSSWLRQSDYFHFEQVNRFIFIGCNAPNMLTELDFKYGVDYSSINLAKYHSLRHLKIDIAKFSRFRWQNRGSCTLNHLQELTLDNYCKKDCDIQPFLNQNCIQMDNIKTVRFQCFGGGAGNTFNSEKFEKLLSAFSNAEYLELCNVFVTNNQIDVVKLKKSYPYLKGLSLSGGGNLRYNEIVKAFAKQLQFLYHVDSAGQRFDLSGMNFCNLQQVVFRNPTFDRVSNVLKAGKDIEKFCIMPRGFFLTCLPSQQLKVIIPQIFKCESLQYFKIDVNDGNWAAILEGIENGLFQTKNIKRKQLKLRVTDKLFHVDLENKMLNILRIINMLHYMHELTPSSVQQFMFILDMDRSMHSQRLKKILNESVDVFSSSNVQCNVDGLKIIISNKDCTINGWKESWMMG